MKRVPGVPVKTSVKPKPPGQQARASPAPSGASAASSTTPESRSASVSSAPDAQAGAAGASKAAPADAAAASTAGHGSAPSAPRAPAAGEVGKHNLPPDREKGLEEMRAAIQRQLSAAADARKAAEGDAGRWLDVKVFVSSTFKDMHAERDRLNKVVFPRLNVEFGQRMQVRFVQIDLRWGLTAEDTSVTGRGAVLCCLDEIERCRPFFLCLLGNRYGWVPEGSYLPISLPPEDLNKYAWLRKWPLGDSVTELEIMYGALGALSPKEAEDLAGTMAAPDDKPESNKPGGGPAELPRAFAFHRDDSFLTAVKDAAGQAVYGSADQPMDPRQRALCERVRASPLFQNFAYTCRYQKQGATLAGLGAFGDAVFGCLSAAATAMREGRAGGRQDHWTLPISLKQTVYAEARAAGCVGRADAVALVSAFAAARDGVHALALVGGPGSGRSTVLARACVDRARAGAPPVAFFEHAAWAPADSRPLERWLHGALERLVPEKDRRGMGYTSKVSQFAGLLPEGTFVCIDASASLPLARAALEQLKPEAGGRLRVAFSCGSREEAAKLCPGATVVELAPLDAGQAGELVRHMLADAGKKLTDPQLAALLAKEGTSTPLYLEIAVSELLLFGVFEKLDGEIKALAPTLGPLIHQCAARMEKDFGATLVQNALGLLCQDGFGLRSLSEAELLAALAVAAPSLQREPAPGAAAGGLRPVSRALWSQVHNSIPHLLRPREADEREPIRFRSVHVARALATRYLLNCVHGGDCFCEDNGFDLEEFNDPSPKKQSDAWAAKWAEKDGRLFQARAVMRLLLPPRWLGGSDELRNVLSRTAYWEKMSEPPGPQAAQVKTYFSGMAEAKQLGSYRLIGYIFGHRSCLFLRSTLGLLRGLARVPTLRKVDLRRMEVVADQVCVGRVYEDSSPKKTLRECFAAVTAFVSTAPALAVFSAPPLLMEEAELESGGGSKKKKGGKKKGKGGEDEAKEKKKGAAKELPELREEYLAALARKRTLTGLSIACPPPALGPLVRSITSLRFLHVHGGSGVHRHLLLHDTLERLTGALGGLGSHTALRAVYVSLPDAELSDRGLAALVASFKGASPSCELWHIRSMPVDIPEGQWRMRQFKEEGGRLSAWGLTLDFGDVDKTRIRAIEMADCLVAAGRTALPTAPTLEQLARGAFAPGSPSRAARIVLGSLSHVAGKGEAYVQPPATIRDVLGARPGDAADQAPDSAPWPIEADVYEDCPLVGLWGGDGGCTLRVQISYADGNFDEPSLVLEVRDGELGTLFGGALWSRTSGGRARAVPAILFRAAPEQVAPAPAGGFGLASGPLLEARICLPPEPSDGAALEVGAVGSPPTASRAFRRVRAGAKPKPAAQ